MRTVKQLAMMGNVTPQTIRNEAKRQRIHFAKDGNSFCCSDEDGDSILTALDIRRAQKTAPNLQPKPKRQDTFTLPFADILQEQLAAKDRQLEAKDKQIERLQAHIDEQSAHIQELMASLTAAQALHAGTIQERLTTSEAAQDEAAVINQEEVKPEKKKGWWARFWGL